MKAHLLRGVEKRLKRHIFRPKIVVEQAGLPLRRLGTIYGGWTFVDSPSLFGSTGVFCGLGEDASFDVAFSREYGATVIAVDPTPRAIAHFRAIAERFGLSAELPQSQDGCLNPASYDLKGLDATRLQLMPLAVASQTGKQKFFAPPNPLHVSYSLTNFQNNYSTETEYIEVDAITLSSLVSQFANVQIVKLDIEGAEADVIPELLDSGYHPPQILAEFDEMNRPSPEARARAEATDACLRDHGYTCVFHDDRSTFTYLRNTA